MNLPEPTLQIEFAAALEGARSTILREALGKVVKRLPVASLDLELSSTVSAEALSALAAKQVRGEAMFPVPLILRAQPSLLGYYRLIYGYSQKQFYAKATGCSVFKLMEHKGKLSSKAENLLDELCAAFANAGALLLSIVEDQLDKADLFHELSLLTLGAQYRGGANNKRGAAGIKAVFEVMRTIVADSISAAGDTSIDVMNAAGKRVTIALASDPDIFIKSYLASGKKPDQSSQLK